MPIKIQVAILPSKIKQERIRKRLSTICDFCNSTKTLRKDGYYVCNVCATKRSNAAYHSSQKTEYLNEYRETNKEKISTIARNNHLKRTFGITLGEYKVVHERQNGLCAICKNPETLTLNGKLKSLAVDHCHNSKKIRGLLCNSCNAGLAQFRDSIERLQSAIEYLKQAENFDIFTIINNPIIESDTIT